MLTPGGVVARLYAERHLIARLTRREIESRFRGSHLGVLWVVINPLLMLVVYTFVFTTVFKARWQGSDGGTLDFALHIFSGLLIFSLFAEVVSRAPNLIVENSSYVKKVVFPIEILACVASGTASFNMLCGFAVFFISYFLMVGIPPITALLLPFVLLPIILFTVGVAWFLSALGVFVRDVQYVVGIVVSMLMFLSPIFYPITAFPEHLRVVILMNPLAPVLHAAENVLFEGTLPNTGLMAAAFLLSGLVAWAGHCFFSLTRRGFADVL